MNKPYKPNNAVKADLNSDFNHGSDSTITPSSTADFPEGGGYIMVEDGVEWAIYEYTGISGGDLTGLQQGQTRNESTSSHTFSSSDSTVHLRVTAGYLNDVIDRLSDAQILGIEFNQTQDTWQRIDQFGNAVERTTGELAEMPLFNEITRVVLDSNGNEVAEWEDDDYSHAPADKSHNVFARFGKRWQRREVVTEGGDRIFRWWLANYSASGFSLNPTFKYGGSERQYAYIGAYNACAYSDDGGTTWYLGSRSGVTPAHGNGDYSGLDGNTLSHFDIEEARQYAQNIGTGFQLYLPWTRGLYTLMNLIYWGAPDLQSLLGRGVVDLASGTGYAGKDTGADSIDSQIDNPTLTGTGTGTDGETPICSLGVSSPYGLIWEFIDGYEAVDAGYRILSRDSFSGIGPPNWTSSDYEVSSASPLTDDDGYISDLEDEELLNLLFIPKATAGSDSTYIPDYLYSHDSGENNILLSGGNWDDGSQAGLSFLLSPDVVGSSNRTYGARLEFIG